MNSKKILIINPINLYPTVMMSQRRALNQIFSLAKNHEVDVVTFNKNKGVAKLSEEFFKDKVNRYIGIKSINYDQKIFAKYYFNLKYMLNYYFRGVRRAVSNYSSKYVVKSLLNIINQKEYDIIISHYWYASFFFLEEFKYDAYRVIDLHAMVDEDIALNANGVFYRMNHNVEKKTNYKNLDFQKEIFNHVNEVIPNSQNQVKILKENYTELPYYYCPNGQDIKKYVAFRDNLYEPKTILFYASFGSLQNNRAFDLFYQNVWPLVLEKEDEAKLLIVGNNPPDSIKSLTKKSNITVTGFVEDIREYLVKASCMVLPMDIGIGFRGRVVEVMALGVPVVGNHNALDCIGLDNEVNGFVTDDYGKMANYTLKLIRDEKYRELISENSIKFIDENYSLSSTFDKLSLYFSSK